MVKRIQLFIFMLILLSSAFQYPAVFAATPSDITATDAETDEVNGFTELSGSRNADIFTIGTNTYAIVVSSTDNGVQIIDITDPTNIVAKDAETDNANGFTVLNGAWDVDTFTISGSTYAIVASVGENGVQIINISNPAAITATDAETHGANGFTMLGGATGVATFTIGASTYAIVASNVSNGVQIIDISNPAAITATDAETDNANGFTELSGARGVATFTIGASTYAIVAGRFDNGVQIIDISNPAAITATDAETDGVNGFTALGATYDVDTFTISGSTYAIVTSINDNGVQIINISNPAAITATDAETDGVNGFTELDDPIGVDTFTISGSTYAIVTTFTDNGIQIIDISNPAAITAADAETNGVNGFTMLVAGGGVDTFTISGSTYAIIIPAASGIQMVLLNSASSSTSTNTNTNNSNGCTVCIPPTIGLDKNSHRIIENGFTLNQNQINVVHFKQNDPTIYANTGDNNTITLNIYEEMGMQNIKYTAIYLGLDSNDIYSNLAKIEWTNYNGVEKIIIIDKNNILTNVFVNTSIIPPVQNSTYAFTATTPNHSTLNVTFGFSSNIPIPYSTVGVIIRDTTGNQMVNYFEDILEIKGEPLVSVSGIVLQDGSVEDFITDYSSNSVKDYALDFNENDKPDDTIIFYTIEHFVLTVFDENDKPDDTTPIGVASTFNLPALFVSDWSEFGFSDVLQNRIQLQQDKVIEQNKLMMMVNENVPVSETVSEIILEKPRVEQYLLDEQESIAQKKMRDILNLDTLGRHNGTDIHNWK